MKTRTFWLVSLLVACFLAVAGCGKNQTPVENPNENAKYFKKLRELSVDIMDKKYDNISMEFLSMGMTGDYEVAIKEGATHVRVGTGIFGERNYK